MTAGELQRLVAWSAFSQLSRGDPGLLDIVRGLLAEGAAPQRIGALMRRDLALSSESAHHCILAARHLAFLETLKFRFVIQ